jgi:hypothetical protein
MPLPNKAWPCPLAIKGIVEAIEQLLELPPVKEKKIIGFHIKK